MKFFVNAGHMPGVDPGAVNTGLGLKEADINRKIGEHLVLLLKYAGHEAELLQSDNLAGENPKYPCVVREANASMADYFISIHCNASVNPPANGSECWVYSRWSEAGNMAEQILRSVTRMLKTKNRGVKESRHMVVLKDTKMPAILVECAFITNTEDAEKLDKRYITFARSIASGILDYLIMKG